MLATTVGGKDLKTLTKATVSATTETEDASLMLHAMPYIMGGTKEKGVLLVNKKAKTLAVHLVWNIFRLFFKKIFVSLLCQCAVDLIERENNEF